MRETYIDSGLYILIGQTPVPEPDTLAWARWFRDRESAIVKQQTVLGICWVSTVFLGTNHSFTRTGRPILFETMSFWQGNHGEEQERCSTWLEAEEMHRQVVAEVARPRSVLHYIGRCFRDYWEAARKDWGDIYREGPVIDSDPIAQYASEQMESLLRRRAERDWVKFG